jgi:hypothetical protein
VLALLAIPTPIAHASVPERTLAPTEAVVVNVDEVTLRRIPSWDAGHSAAATLSVRGVLPTPCHEAKWSVETTDGSIEVNLWGESTQGDRCAQLAEPFEMVISIAAVLEGEQIVRLNGEAVGRLDVQLVVVADDALLVGAGWAFGFCGGLCRAELSLDGSRVQVVTGGYLPVPGDALNQGRLTETGLARFDEAIERLDGKVLEQLYGCPDCADGGSASLTFEQAGVISEHLMNYQAPPDELAEIYRLSMDVIDAFMACRSDALVEVDDACVMVRDR